MNRPALHVLSNNGHPPEDLKKVTELHITARVADLGPEDFRGLGHLRSLTLGPQLDEIERPVLPFRATEKVVVLHSGLFAHLKGLRALHVVMKGVVAVESGAFSGMTGLKDLSLEGNRIAVLEPGAFSGLSRLESLSLEGNHLTEIKRHYFESLSSLARLNLGSNQIRRIESRAFSALPELISLDLAHNPFRGLNPSCLSGLRDSTQISIGWLGHFLSTSKRELVTGIN